MSGNVPFRCKIGLKIETQWADIVCLVFQNYYYRLLVAVLQVWFHEVTLLFVAHSVPAQNRPGPMHELSEGGTGGVAVHARHATRTCGGTTGSPCGTILVVQLLEVCNTNSETQDTRYQPIVFESYNQSRVFLVLIFLLFRRKISEFRLNCFKFTR